VVARLADSREDANNRMLSMWMQAEMALLDDYFGAGYSAGRRQKKVELPEGDEASFVAVKDRIKGLLWE
jgi:hypothetical protein